jgi:hypothetical protein
MVSAVADMGAEHGALLVRHDGAESPIFVPQRLRRHPRRVRSRHRCPLHGNAPRSALQTNWRIRLGAEPRAGGLVIEIRLLEPVADSPLAWPGYSGGRTRRTVVMGPVAARLPNQNRAWPMSVTGQLSTSARAEPRRTLYWLVDSVPVLATMDDRRPAVRLYLRWPARSYSRP